MPARASSPRPTPGSLELAALRYLARRERTEAQVRAFLSRAGASASRIRALLSRFRDQGYLDDRAFALRWAEERLARCPMGRARLEAELLGKGFERATVAATLQRVCGGTSELVLARALLAKRLGRGEADRRRGPGLLRRYGFEEEIIEELFGVNESP